MSDLTWLPITGYETCYEVSNLGHVKRIKAAKGAVLGKTLKTWRSHGYDMVTLSDGSKKKHHFVHRLLATAFLPNPKQKAEVNHKDGVRSNNEMSNLEWVTHQENHIHRAHVLGHARGVQHGMAKLSESDAVNIYGLHLIGVSMRTLRRLFNMSTGAIDAICSRRTWHHVTNPQTQ